MSAFNADEVVPIKSSRVTHRHKKWDLFIGILFLSYVVGTAVGEGWQDKATTFGQLGDVHVNLEKEVSRWSI